MNKIIESHESVLQNLIGSSIEYAILPELNIKNSAILPEGNCQINEYDHFFNSHSIYWSQIRV